MSSLEMSTSLIEEQKIQENIFNSIDNGENIIFNAGAGAGKTYALIESLKYIINKYGKNLNTHNQKIMCITYTNVAVNEIKERLGNSQLVKVSTIHERLWKIIRKHQKQLVKIHTQKLKDEIEKLTNDLYEDEDYIIKFKAFRDLGTESQKQFKEYIITQKDVFYKNYNEGAGVFRDSFNNNIDVYTDIIKNVGNFKKIVNTLYKIDNNKYCLSQIELVNAGDKSKRKIDYKKIRYDLDANNAKIHRMEITHDDLLEYALKIIKEYDLLKQIVIDSYPYILIDEYQDTNQNVVEIMKLFSEYSDNIEHKMFIGYFGDTVQSIYDDGISSSIEQIHPNLKKIDKIYNRRSRKEVIDVINEIRNDSIEQKSIHENYTGGSVKFYYCPTDDQESVSDNFIQKYKNQWQINKDNKLHCLVLTNKLIAKFNKFEEIYEIFSKTDYYKIFYENIKTELLSDEPNKLGKVPSAFRKISELRTLVNNPQTTLVQLLPNKKDIDFEQFKKLITQLKCIRGKTLKSYIKSIFSKYDQADINSHFRLVIENYINFNEYSSYDAFLNYLFTELYPNLDTENNEKKSAASQTLNNLLNIDFSQYIRWYNFINEIQYSDVVYHTYHGTKGREFKNVIIIMQNNFGKDRKKFSSFFENISNFSSLEETEKSKFENTKNLLYVSCSRAIENLRILYLDDIFDFKDGIIGIFGKVYPYSKNSTTGE